MPHHLYRCFLWGQWKDKASLCLLGLEDKELSKCCHSSKSKQCTVPNRSEWNITSETGCFSEISRNFQYQTLILTNTNSEFPSTFKRISQQMWRQIFYRELEKKEKPGSIYGRSLSLPETNFMVWTFAENHLTLHFVKPEFTGYLDILKELPCKAGRHFWTAWIISLKSNTHSEFIQVSLVKPQRITRSALIYKFSPKKSELCSEFSLKV